jgi:hypothetical protein
VTDSEDEFPDCDVHDEREVVVELDAPERAVEFPSRTFNAASACSSRSSFLSLKLTRDWEKTFAKTAINTFMSTCPKPNPIIMKKI